MEDEFKFKMQIINTLSKCGDITDAEEHYIGLLRKKEEFLESERNQFFIRCMEALGNQDRLIILSTLLEQDRCSCEIEAILQKSQPAVSRHLSILENAGLIQGWKKGKFTHYSVIKSSMDKIIKIFQLWTKATENWFGERLVVN